MSFASKFDPTNKDHVLWLQKVDDAMVEIMTNNKKMDMVQVVNDNPFKAKIKNPLEWADAHFQLALKYSQAVLRGTAFIPESFVK
jgi:hypothetical protein